MCLAQGPQPSDTGEAQTRCLSISIQAVYHWATALPYVNSDSHYELKRFSKPSCFDSEGHY